MFVIIIGCVWRFGPAGPPAGPTFGPRFGPPFGLPLGPPVGLPPGPPVGPPVGGGPPAVTGATCRGAGCGLRR
jgi:hypothetical protein